MVLCNGCYKGCPNGTARSTPLCQLRQGITLSCRICKEQVKRVPDGVFYMDSTDSSNILYKITALCSHHFNPHKKQTSTTVHWVKMGPSNVHKGARLCCSVPSCKYSLTPQSPSKYKFFVRLEGMGGGHVYACQTACGDCFRK
jgi:hypothetical protein